MAPSRAPITFRSANSAGVKPTEPRTSAVRVWNARQSRKKSCPANSVTGGSAEGGVVIFFDLCTLSSASPIICDTNYQLMHTSGRDGPDVGGTMTTKKVTQK